MVITQLTPQWPPSGPRPINLKYDVPQVTALLELAFGEKLDPEGRESVYTSNSAFFLWQLDRDYRRLPPGYVWQEDGRIIGNVTLINTRTPGRHIIANVAVHPDYRRRGIARALMEAVLAQVRARHGQTVVLQVLKDNVNAIRLYESMHFTQIGAMTEWRSSTARLRDIPPTSFGDAGAENRVEIRPLPASQWQAAFALDSHSLNADLTWPEPIPADFYRQGLLRSLRNFLRGWSQESWVTQDADGQLTGIATISAEWGGPYTLRLRVLPEQRDKLTRPLLAKLIRRLKNQSRRTIVIHHPDEDEPMNQLLRAANFSPRRTLTHMRYDVT